MSAASCLMMAGLKMVQVAYRGDAPAITDLIGGQVHVYFGTLPHRSRFVRAGRLRALAVTVQRALRHCQTFRPMAEFLLPGYEATIWNGLSGPKGTPVDVVGNSTARSMQRWPIPRWSHDLPNWVRR